MPCKISPRTDPLLCYQLIDLLNETGRLEEGKFTLVMTGEVSERIHDRILFVTGDWHGDEQKIHDDRVIGKDSIIVVLKKA